MGPKNVKKDTSAQPSKLVDKNIIENFFINEKNLDNLIRAKLDEEQEPTYLGNQHNLTNPFNLQENMIAPKMPYTNVSSTKSTYFL